jgi:hypothetical protein
MQGGPEDPVRLIYSTLSQKIIPSVISLLEARLDVRALLRQLFAHAALHGLLELLPQPVIQMVQAILMEDSTSLGVGVF